ncbi:hypothetical protein EYZ11_000237 [Aspergillus tanneri]|uniref:Uncharacterized protein n=1 Tax=Aspergillus tanneri TaxID=1220188 RepID=A0A4S3JY83_9EURO|nr:hypothetical protein EYZ11_000237 [Aspergillus tanneri]
MNPTTRRTNIEKTLRCPHCIVSNAASPRPSGGPGEIWIRNNPSGNRASVVEATGDHTETKLSINVTISLETLPMPILMVAAAVAEFGRELTGIDLALSLRTVDSSVSLDEDMAGEDLYREQSSVLI